MSALDARLGILLRDFGYQMQGNILISKGIKGFTSDRIVGSFRSVLSAAEYLCPIVSDEEYTNRFVKATQSEGS